MGKAKASKVSKDLHKLLEDLTQRVIDGELETSRGVVANQVIGTGIRLLDIRAAGSVQPVVPHK